MLTLTDCGRVAGDQLRMRAQMTTDAYNVEAAVFVRGFCMCYVFLPRELAQNLNKIEIEGVRGRSKANK